MFLLGFVLILVGVVLFVWNRIYGIKYDRYALVLALIAFTVGTLTLLLAWLM